MHSSFFCLSSHTCRHPRVTKQQKQTQKRCMVHFVLVSCPLCLSAHTIRRVGSIHKSALSRNCVSYARSDAGHTQVNYVKHMFQSIHSQKDTVLYIYNDYYHYYYSLTHKPTQHATHVQHSDGGCLLHAASTALAACCAHACFWCSA